MRERNESRISIKNQFRYIYIYKETIAVVSAQNYEKKENNYFLLIQKLES